jgi:hypothetical protein
MTKWRALAGGFASSAFDTCASAAVVTAATTLKDISG